MTTVFTPYIVIICYHMLYIVIICYHMDCNKCFAFYILTTNYYCSLYNNILYLLLVMNKRHSFIRLIQIKKELSRCYSYLTKSWHKVINKNSIDNFF